MAAVVGGALLSAFFQVAFEKLASTQFRYYFRRHKLDYRMVKKLEITLNSISHVLDDAEKKQYQSTYVKKWLDDLKHAVYETDLLLDEIATHAQLNKSQPATSKVRGFFSSSTNRFASRIKELLENLEFLAKQSKSLGLENITCARNDGGVSWKLLERLPTTSLVDHSEIYGREYDKGEIINFLLSNNACGNRVPIICIVGMGGMGKTTLAQLVYNDQRMQAHFDLKAWVHVSEKFDVVGVTKAILKAFQFSTDVEDLNLLQIELQQRLRGKKFLLVLDDVWNEDYASWELLQRPFNNGSSESKILVTTRDKKVASIMKCTQQLHLNQLEEKDCWSLFVRHAFNDKKVSEYPDLESTGKKIVDKCGGLPLAIKTLGNLLQRKFSQSEWDKILETDMWCLSEDNDINPALRLSYHILPSNLKHCFAYCSIFPKGYVFSKDELIELWMAEGLLICCGTDKSEEELGNEFFNDLESILFFQQLEKRNDCFIMHDLVNDLAKSVLGEFCLRIESSKVQDILKRTRHVSFFNESTNADKIVEHICEYKGLRSLMTRGSQIRINKDVQLVLFSRLKHLRVLSFTSCPLLELADEICNLKLLRYLDLSYTQIKRLPDSICMLHNLQTFKLTMCLSLTELPSDFYRLANLRHLHLEKTPLEKMPKHMGRLKHLRTLTDFIVGNCSGSDIRELGNLNHLQGRLHISGLENVIDPADATEANLKDKKNLGKLCFASQRMSTKDDDSINLKHVLEVLQPNRNLNWLTIAQYYGTSFPDWLGHFHLPNLVYVNLQFCLYCECLPPLGQLPSLKELYISNCSKIEMVDAQFYGNNSSNVPFRSLEILHLYCMPRLKQWFCFEGGEGFPSLKELYIYVCPRLEKTLPQHLPSMQKLVIRDCQKLDAALPKAANTRELELSRCGNILLNEIPSNLKKASISGTQIIESSLGQILCNSASLEELNVDDFSGPNLKCSLNLHSCNSLRTLSIQRWFSSSLPFARDLFSSLQSLTLHCCPQLESFPGNGLPLSLSRLHIVRCPKLIASRKEWSLYKLYSLKEFLIADDFENVESFPEENLLPSNINHLNLWDCSKLKIINYKGLFHLKSLQSLTISGCPCLERLPEEGLPDSLAGLLIESCPLLKQRYQKEEGERWHKIRHIPNVSIW